MHSARRPEVSLSITAGSNQQSNRGLSSRGSTATGSTPSGADRPSASRSGLQAYSDAEAWLQQGQYLALRGSYGLAKVCICQWLIPD